MPETKVCTRCQETKSVSEFCKATNINASGTSYYSARCKKCTAEIAREKRKADGGEASRLATAKWRKANPKKATAGVQANRLARVKNQYAFLTTHPCVLCGETNPIKLEFDHIIPVNSAKIPRLQTWTKRKQTEPSDKNVQVLCANCHRIKTHRERNSVRWQLFCASEAEKESSST